MRVGLILFFLSALIAQTHVSVPQSVWRIRVNNEFFSGDWKGPNGEDGINGMQSLWNNQVWTINEMRSRSGRKTTTLIDYGLSDKMNLSITIPYFGSLEEKKTFFVSPTDTAGISPDSIISRFHPSTRSNFGLGDVSLELRYLLYGTPTWSGKGAVSVYGGVSVTLPTAERLGPYESGSVDTSGIPLQFYELPIGQGLMEYKISLGGEFYRRIFGRMSTLRWNVHYAAFSQEQVNAPLSFVGFDESSPDSLAALIGSKHLYRHGNTFSGNFSGRYEVLKEKLIVEAGVDWTFTGRDLFRSNSSTWDNWMEYRQVKGSTIHSTKRARIRQFLTVRYQNVDPIKKIGPFPFELEAGLIFPMSLLVRNEFNTTALRLGITTYTQMW